MFITPSTLAYARARRQELEREAGHQRRLRAARAVLRSCCAEADEACCEPGCCVDPDGCAGSDCCAGDADARASQSRARGAAHPQAAGWARVAGGFAALLLRSTRPLRTTREAGCAPTGAAA